MSRLFILMLGILIGAAGVFYLMHDDVDRTRANARAELLVGANADAGSSNLDLPALPAVPEPGELVVAEPVVLESPTFVPAAVASDADQAFASTSAPASAGLLLIPVPGIKVEQLSDTYAQSRGLGRSHDAIDIMAPRGTPVVAVDDGKVVKLFNSKQGGLTVYQFDREEKLAYYYAHLDRYADGVAEGSTLKRGELVGYVGSTGNANALAPHLHFAVFVLGPEKRWWKGTAVNPFLLLGGRPATASAGKVAPGTGGGD